MASYRESAAEDRSVLVVAYNGRVFGLEPSTGRRLWEHDLGNWAGEVELLVHANRVFACDGKSLVCFSYPQGDFVGRVEVPGTYHGRPTMLLERDRVFVATRGELACFNMDGQLLWKDPFEGKGVGSMALGFPDNVRQADDRGSK